MDTSRRTSFLDPVRSRPDRPLRVVPLFSGGASGARYCEVNDDRYGEAYTFPAAISSNPDAHGIDRLETEVAVHDIEAFYATRDAEITDLAVREDYDEALVDRLATYDPDLVMLSGYMYLVTDVLLRRYPAINVHPADLRITDDGERVYTGMDPVYDAIVAGEAETRSSVHFVTLGVDEGPLITVSNPAPVHRVMVDDLEGDALRTYADLHQAWMKDRCDGPAFVAALHLIADGRVDWADDGMTIDGGSGPHVLDA